MEITRGCDTVHCPQIFFRVKIRGVFRILITPLDVGSGVPVLHHEHGCWYTEDPDRDPKERVRSHVSQWVTPVTESVPNDYSSKSSRHVLQGLYHVLETYRHMEKVLPQVSKEVKDFSDGLNLLLFVPTELERDSWSSTTPRGPSSTTSKT